MTKARLIGRYIFLILASMISVFPIVWMAISATNTSVDVVSGRMLPGTYLVQNFKNLLANQDVAGAMTNSFQYSIVLTLLSLLICSLAGYGFEIFHDRGKDTVMSILLLAMMVPFAATMIPLFQMFSKAQLLNTTAGFILPTISTPFLIMLFRQIDGLSEVGIFFRMFFPTMRSTYAAAMTITFMNAWNSYLWPKVIMQDNASITMPMLVANLKEGYVTDYGMLMVAVLRCTIPTIIIFFLLQKSFAEGITGAVK